MPGTMKRSVFSGIPSLDDAKHYQSMRGGDNQISYTETGDMVIPPEVQQANPALMMAAIKTFRDLGANPNQYISGHPEGSYNPDTQAQEFAWYDDLLTNASTYTQKAANFVANNDLAKAALTGTVTAAGAKLAGADTKGALAAGAGAGLGYYAGDKLSTGFNNLDNNKGFFDPKAKTNYTSKTVGESLANLGKSINYGALSGAAGLGTTALAMFGTPQSQLNDLQLAPTKDLSLAPMSPVPNYLKMAQNQQANLSATLPQNLPIAPMTPAALKGTSGVSFKKKVKDRDTGRFSYVDANENNDAGSFSRALNSKSRRKGFGGSLIFA